MMKTPEKLSVAFLFDDTLDSSDGVAQYVKTLGSWLSNQGHDISYFVGESKIKDWAGGRVYSLSKNLSVSFNGNRMSTPRPSSREPIEAALENEKPDVLHVMMPYSPFMAMRARNSSDPSVAVVGTFHIFPAGIFSKLGSLLLAQLLRRSFRRFTSMWAVSQPSADFAREVFGIDTSVIPNPVDLKKFITTGRAKNELLNTKIVFLGRLVKRKGCSELIDAFAHLSKRMKNIELVIAGDGSERQSLEKKVKTLGIDQRVSFLGYIEESNKPTLLASADIACFPSLYGESFGIVLVEAMAAGAGAVIGGDNPGYRSVLGEQEDLLFNPSDVNAFADKLQQLVVNKDMIKKMHEWQSQAVKQYDVNLVGAQLLRGYKRAIAQNSENRNN